MLLCTTLVLQTAPINADGLLPAISTAVGLQFVDTDSNR